MSQTDSRMLVLGALAGVAGLSLAVVCYRGFGTRRRSHWPGFRVSRASEPGPGLVLVDGPGLQTGQAEVLERLEALIWCVSELKEEMKLLRSALPALQDHVRVERRGQGEAHRGSPLHRMAPTRRKRPPGAPGGAGGGGRSSEEAESEGG